MLVPANAFMRESFKIDIDSCVAGLVTVLTHRHLRDAHVNEVGALSYLQCMIRCDERSRIFALGPSVVPSSLLKK